MTKRKRKRTATTTITTELPAGNVIFGLGANLGARERTLRWALAKLERFIGPLDVAALYRSAPVSSATASPGTFFSGTVSAGSQGEYLNTAARGRLERPMSCRYLLARLKELERQAGRFDVGIDAPRPLDIDVLAAGQTVIDLPQLGEDGIDDPEIDHASGPSSWPGAVRIPHPRLRQRRFVLLPLMDLAPELELPPDGRRVHQLLAEIGRQQDVEEIGWSDPV